MPRGNHPIRILSRLILNSTCHPPELWGNKAIQKHSHSPGYGTTQPVDQVPTSLPRNTRVKARPSKNEQQVKHANDGDQRFPESSQLSPCVVFKDSFILKETMFPKSGFS